MKTVPGRGAGMTTSVAASLLLLMTQSWAQQIFRGPQSLLQGRNSIAGTVAYKIPGGR